ncbi:MAG TPA: FHA domain-containing protein, partial [Mycobacterium sp.]|nr:FHA domain-containing protein [Mycobacterium sp.]
MAGPPLIEIREWGRPARRLVLSRPIVVGRDCTGAILADERVSRQHLRLVPSPTALSVVDLGSRNGTTVNGLALTRRVALVPGDVVRLGRSEIIVLHTPTVDPSVLELEHDATRLAHVVVAAPPPPPPPGRTARSPFVTLAERILGIDAGGERQPFPSYNEMTSKVPLRVWQVVRVASIVALLALVAMMFLRPAAGLFVFFQVIVPLLPLLFLVAPGLWRNICPLAASNQLPRVLGISRGRTAPNWLRNRGYLIAVTLFVGIAAARLAGLDRSGAATGTVLGAVLAT